MKRNANRKLGLNRETLRHLQNDDVQRANGGRRNNDDSDGCSTACTVISQPSCKTCPENGTHCEPVAVSYKA